MAAQRAHLGPAAGLLRTQRRALQVPLLYPVASVVVLLVIWPVLVLSQEIAHSGVAPRTLFDVVFAVNFAEAWYALAVIAAIVVALSLAALSSAGPPEEASDSELIEYLTRGRQLRLLARSSAIAASVVAVDASVTEIATAAHLPVVEIAVLLAVSYFLGAIGEDAGRRSNPLRALEAQLQEHVVQFETYRLQRARVFWRPSTRSRPRRQVLAALALPIAMVALAVVGALTGDWEEALVLVVAALLLTAELVVALGSAYGVARALLNRDSSTLIGPVVALLVVLALPLTIAVAGIVSGDRDVDAETRVVLLVAAVVWVVPWLVGAWWLLAGRHYDARRGKYDPFSPLSSLLVRHIDRRLRRLAATTTSRSTPSALARWHSRVSGWPL